MGWRYRHSTQLISDWIIRIGMNEKYGTGKAQAILDWCRALSNKINTNREKAPKFHFFQKVVYVLHHIITS